MCMFKTPKVSAPPTVVAPPPPEKAPAELENAVDSNATGLQKRKRGAKKVLGRGSSGAQYSGAASGSGLSINK